MPLEHGSHPGLTPPPSDALCISRALLHTSRGSTQHDPPVCSVFQFISFHSPHSVEILSTPTVQWVFLTCGWASVPLQREGIPEAHCQPLCWQQRHREGCDPCSNLSDLNPTPRWGACAIIFTEPSGRFPRAAPAGSGRFHAALSAAPGSHVWSHTVPPPCDASWGGAAAVRCFPHPTGMVAVRTMGFLKPFDWVLQQGRPGGSTTVALGFVLGSYWGYRHTEPPCHSQQQTNPLIHAKINSLHRFKTTWA